MKKLNNNQKLLDKLNAQFAEELGFDVMLRDMTDYLMDKIGMTGQCAVGEDELPGVYEMIADWASANFEQMNIIHDPEAVEIETWFQNKMADQGRTDEQMDIIKKSFEIIHTNTDDEHVKSIWAPLLEKADL